MIEIRVTNELNTYEPKAIGPFTLRQLICVIVGAPVCYLIISGLSPTLTVETAGLLCLIPASIGYAFGWCRPYGMRTEQFIKSILITRFLAPARRSYQTENTHSTLLHQYDTMCEAEQNKLGKKQKGAQLKRYKLSPKAYK